MGVARHRPSPPARPDAAADGRRLPEQTTSSDLDRIEALAEAGRAAGLHLVVAGWPPATRRPLPQATRLELRTAYALLGDPPGSPFSGPGADSPAD